MMQEITVSELTNFTGATDENVIQCNQLIRERLSRLKMIVNNVLSCVR